MSKKNNTLVEKADADKTMIENKEEHIGEKIKIYCTIPLKLY